MIAMQYSACVLASHESRLSPAPTGNVRYGQCQHLQRVEEWTRQDVVLSNRQMKNCRKLFFFFFSFFSLVGILV